MKSKKQILESMIHKAVKKVLSENKNFEYVLWGIPPGKSEEVLLATKVDGQIITDLKLAERMKNVLETKHGCKSVRIQTVNMTDGDFSSFKRPF